MFGLLRKSNFSLEKLSLYSFILVLETTGISSPACVPAVFKCLKVARKDVSMHILSGKQKGRSVLNFNVTKLTIYLNSTILSSIALLKSLYAKILHY